jgi:hypothetical protein
MSNTADVTGDKPRVPLFRSYFKGISANIELQVYSGACCWPNLHKLYLNIVKGLFPGKLITIVQLREIDKLFGEETYFSTTQRNFDWQNWSFKPREIFCSFPLNFYTLNTKLW